MTGLAALRGDFHIHSVFSDDAVSTLAENLEAAEARGLARVRFIDHVRQSTSWVPDFVAAVGSLAVPSSIELFTGVEAKLVDTRGTIDVPDDLVGVGAIVIADHQFPAADGPWSPGETRERIAAGLSPDAVIEQFVDASVAAMTEFEHRHPGLDAQLAHWFSILPKVGLSEEQLTDEQLERWARAAADTGTAIEVNEKWACPGPRAIRAALAAGAPIVAATDSHDSSEVGRYDRVAAILEEATA